MKTTLIDGSVATEARNEHALALVIFVIVVVVADEVPAGAAVVGRGGGRRGGLGEERQTEGGRRRTLLAGGAAVGTLPGADGLQHAALPFLQHVLLGTGKEDRHDYTLNNPFNASTGRLQACFCCVSRIK